MNLTKLDSGKFFHYLVRIIEGELFGRVYKNSKGLFGKPP